MRSPDKNERMSDHAAQLEVVVTGGIDGKGGASGPLVILMHGFGAPGDDLVAIGEALEGSVPAGTRFAFPQAPIDLGPMFMGGRAWWHIDLEERMRRQARGERDVKEIPDGLHAISDAIASLVRALCEQLSPPASKVVLGGFSQGAMLALDVALRSDVALAGLVLLSGTHIASEEWNGFLDAGARRGLPVFQSHGEQDPVLPFSVSLDLKNTMVSAGLPVDWIPFRGGHAIPPPVLAGLAAFLKRVLS